MTDGLSEEKVRQLEKRYDVYLDLFKFYLDCVLKIVVSFYGITGAILTIYFKFPDFAKLSIHVLLFPGLFSLVLAAVFVHGASLAKLMRDELAEIRTQLGIEGAPHVQILISSLRLSAVLFLLTGGPLLGYWAWTVFGKALSSGIGWL